MQILNNSNCMTTPVDYMYQNPYYGGAGYNIPAPQFYQIPQQQYGYQQAYGPYMQQQMNSNFGQPNQQPQQTSMFDDTIPMGLSQTPSMQKQFEYQNDYRYQYYGNNNTSYYPGYGQSYGYGYGSTYNPYAYQEEGFYNPYLSNTMMQNMSNDMASRDSQPKKNMYTMSGVQNYSYFSIAEQQKIIQEQQEQQRQIHEMLCGLNCRWFGMDGNLADYNKEKFNEEMERRYRKQVEFQNEANLCNYINYLASTAPPPETYESSARKRYIAEWNRKYDEWNAKFPENYTVYEFFNESIAENMYMECKIEQAKMMDKQLNQLYNQNAFRDQLSRLHPGYTPRSGISTYTVGKPRMPLTIDDMEVRLPDSIKNTEDFKRREKFINSIIGNMNM